MVLLLRGCKITPRKVASLVLEKNIFFYVFVSLMRTVSWYLMPTVRSIYVIPLPSPVGAQSSAPFYEHLKGFSLVLPPW